MKTFTYAAAIALLTASAAFAQSSPNNSSMMNNTTPTPSMSGPAEGNGGSSSQPTMAQPSQSGGSDMSSDADMGKAPGKAMKHQGVQRQGQTRRQQQDHEERHAR